jgi:flagellar hook-associated protein 1 FlgK
MASAMSDRTTAGTAATSGAQTGFDVDLAGLQAGNTINLTYTNASGTHKLTIMRVDDPSVLPLNNNATLDPSDQVIGVDFSGGMASVVAQINAALSASGSGVTASNPSGQTLRILDDGAVGTSDVVGLSTTITQSSLVNGGPELPLFTDGGLPFTGAITQAGSQITGLAGRIAINMQLLGDPSKLLTYSATTLTGDTTRPDFLYNQLQSATFYFSPDTGLGTSASPYKGTMMGFTQQVMALQGEASNSASQLAEGQDVVVNTLQEKFNAASGVNIDEEMAHLLALQNAYAANARVMSVVKDMFQALLNA